MSMKNIENTWNRSKTNTLCNDLWLELDIDSDPERLVGCYYTDRKTSGDIDVRRLKSTTNGEPVAAAA
jgi:hypothetical protein